jgi:NAD+ synthetase
VHRKNFLPTYGMFDEERFVERGLGISAFDWTHSRELGRAAMLVCEDAWHSLSGTLAALDGAEIVFLSSAAPARGPVSGRPSTVDRWERLVRDIAEEHGVYVAYSSLVGSEGGKLLSGASMIAGPRGDIRVRAPLWDESIITATIDLDDVHRARADMPLLSDLKTAMPHIRVDLDRIALGMRQPAEWDDAEGAASGSARVAGDEPSPASGAADKPAPAKARTARRKEREPSVARSSGREAPVMALPVVAASPGASAPPTLAIDPALLEEWLVRFIRDEFEQRGFAKAIVGVSGGLDSAVTASLAARALGSSNVIGVRMPYRTSSADSLDHAAVLIDSLGIESRTLDISAAVDGYLEHEPDADGARRGNVMARVRMIALFDLSARHKAIPVGTGNKTERLFGYFTWHADDSPPVNPLGDLFKTQVRVLARHLGIPDAIVSKAPSADLVVGQTDEGDFGISYEKADEILNWLLNGYPDDALIARGFEAEEVALVHRRLSTTHWKRRLPTVAMVSSSAIGESYMRPVDY